MLQASDLAPYSVYPQRWSLPQDEYEAQPLSETAEKAS